MIVDILRGSERRRIVGTGLDRESTYGLMADVPENGLRRIVDALIAQGFAAVSDGQYPVLTLTAKSADVLYRKCRVEMRVPASENAAHAKKRQKNDNACSDGLLAELNKLRATLAAEAKVPAYLVFTDAALSDMCQKLPETEEEFLKVSGVGKRKLERYSAEFLKAITEYRKSSRKSIRA